MTPLVPKPLTSNSKAEGRFDKRDFVYIAADDEYRCPAGQRAIKRFTTIERGMTLHKYWSSACPRCPLKAQCTTSDYRRITRWEHEAVLEAMQERLDQQPDAMKLRRQTVEHPFGTLKAWMGSTHFLTKRLPRVSTEMSLHVLAYNLKRVMQILGIVPLRNLSGRHSLEFLQRGINRVPRMAADAVCDHLRIELAWVVKAGRVDRYQFRHCDECQVDRRSTGRAESVDLFARRPERYRLARRPS